MFGLINKSMGNEYAREKFLSLAFLSLNYNLIFTVGGSYTDLGLLQGTVSCLDMRSVVY